MEELLDKYFELQAEIHRQFGYAERSEIVPLHDSRAYCWYLNLNGDGFGVIYFAPTRKELLDDIDDLRNPDRTCTVESVRPPSFMAERVYRNENFTAVRCDSMFEGCKLLRVFDNIREYRPVSKPVEPKQPKAKRARKAKEPVEDTTEE